MIVTAKFFSNLALVLLVLERGSAFSNTLFATAPVEKTTFPTDVDGVGIELPDFDELFHRIQVVSPLSKLVMDGGSANGARGFAGVKASDPNDLQWKSVESNSKRKVHAVQKIDNFQGLPAPLLRFRATLDGPCLGEPFANFIMETKWREKWDAQIDHVYEAYSVQDLESANIAMGFGKYGHCQRLGIGHCKTKKNLGIDAREQLTICGINDFADGSCVIWGTEMEESHNHLFPPGQRSTRAKSHLFASTLTPIGGNKFDVEYIIQLEIGGNLPVWMTTPVVIDNIKKFFRCVDGFFSNANGDLDKYIEESMQAMQAKNHGYSLLLTP